MRGRLQPALLGGVFIGVLSTLPIINIGNLCCCRWVISGGALAAYLLQQNQPEPITGAQPDDIINEGDTLVTVGKLGQYPEFRRLLAEGP